MPLGVYISVPFCRTKCTYCNFASDVFSRAVFERYVDRVCEDIGNAERNALEIGGRFEQAADSVYLGGGTPTVLDPAQLERIFSALGDRLDVNAGAEITVECAPGTLSDSMLETLLGVGVNRMSLGVQSFVDREAAAVGRLHQRETVLRDVERLRQAGITNINIDLIAGLPHQTEERWEFSLSEIIASRVPHVSVYMLEVDEDSRLGREVMAGGTRYHAHFVPDEDATADFYVVACERLSAAGIAQYEISNFAREGFESRHNLKYWTRQPYFGFGVDAHSMLVSDSAKFDAARFAGSDSLERYVSGSPLQCNAISREAALEENFFLGLRLNRGVDLRELSFRFGAEAIAALRPDIAELVEAGLVQLCGDVMNLTSRGRLLSNEVFEKFIARILAAS